MLELLCAGASMHIPSSLMQAKFFWDQIKQHISFWDRVGLISSSLFINVLSLAFPIMLLQVYDRIIPNLAIDTLTLLIVGVISALILEAILRTARSFITAWIDARFEHLLGTKTFNTILNAQIKDYEMVGTGVYLEHLNAINILKDFYSNQIFSVMLDLPFILLFVALIAYIANMIVLIPLIILALLIWEANSLSKYLSANLNDKRIADDKRINFVISAISGIHGIKSMALEMQMLRRYERIHESTCYHDYQLGLKSSVATLSSNFASQISTVTVLVVGSMIVVQGGLTIGGLAACVLLTSRILQPASRAVSVFTRLQAVNLAQQRLKEVQQLPQENSAALADMPVIKGNIILENLSFRYSKDHPWILQKANLSIQAGEIIAINSQGLSGKSSLLWLIMGILQPVEGRILIDDHDLRYFNQHSIRQQIAYIPQRGTLFHGTIMENLTMFRSSHIEIARQFADTLGLTSSIYQLPKGFETIVGKESVESLPYGLKQRICIARALLDEPRIILFDEANLSIDRYSGEILKAALMEYGKHRTWIVVSNRPLLLELAHRVFTLEKGQLKEVKAYGATSNL